jgi:hypothetical protein
VTVRNILSITGPLGSRSLHFFSFRKGVGFNSDGNPLLSLCAWPSNGIAHLRDFRLPLRSR